MTVGNRNDANKGRQVRTTREIRVNPWWEDERVTVPAGTVGTVVRVESHGTTPHTRYTVRFGPDQRNAGMAHGFDFEWV